MGRASGVNRCREGRGIRMPNRHAAGDGMKPIEMSRSGRCARPHSGDESVHCFGNEPDAAGRPLQVKAIVEDTSRDGHIRVVPWLVR